MNEQRKCLVGHDDDGGWVFGIAIAVLLLADSIPSRITFLRLSTMWLTATVNLYP